MKDFRLWRSGLSFGVGAGSHLAPVGGNLCRAAPCSGTAPPLMVRAKVRLVGRWRARCRWRISLPAGKTEVATTSYDESASLRPRRGRGPLTLAQHPASNGSALVNVGRGFAHRRRRSFADTRIVSARLRPRRYARVAGILRPVRCRSDAGTGRRAAGSPDPSPTCVAPTIIGGYGAPLHRRVRPGCGPRKRKRCASINFRLPQRERAILRFGLGPAPDFARRVARGCRFDRNETRLR